MTKKISSTAFLVFRLGVTLLFLLSLFAIDFDNPKDIVSITTLHRIAHPHVLFHVVETNLLKIVRLISDGAWQYITAALGVHLACIGLLTVRWQMLLSLQGMRIGFFRLFAYYLIGFFFNNFLPTNIGGDISRVINTAKHKGKTVESVAVVFMERFIGFLAVFVLALVSMLLNRQWIGNLPALYALVLFAFAIGATLLVLFNKTIRTAVKTLIARVGFIHLNNTLAKLFQSIQLFQGNARALVVVLALSFVYQFVLALYTMLAAHGVHAPAPFFPVFFVIQITTLICVIPISMNGLGVREYLYVQILLLSGVPAERTMALQLVLFCIMYFESLMGGCLFLLQKGIKKARDTGMFTASSLGGKIGSHK
ncbi:MAG: hypothetical protein A2487_04445 [Candidatus Raymondbacteria bacterium RifOxyC12_full_50_8]|uniref:Flippase-like domain-containing protein n=1 Tax=Candidatus Raymondbacteria bacterium RIFOXYD12_FULL_49_13 TaxID=1817890 RepID=A0A1F7F071_UNCRA|nr:MAG: hypothetical protein A2350_10935 [Candidatus Raymondbacteria bacterium RifOxyB12_full_50_8]OGJ93387.1 MAG: hypothetical protein A2248_21605 [Candidatus Raymondbacteria bacterium RIFOXYA2_FULL_49_16]OGJ98488.1 MAG: hypothetical protein A2487_04445 [Candidatus Raymondbacteria bacterium RifOxyC12_full_50_8]OGK00035.1 MAG: hypothetical protein A2519_22160 [Candidatus Raymondbacteria bacterium RIFOXYD12_FULL_49_13]OGP45024.1 MAG: hypothetical protein A2324_13485 [Candidatus Raymondbacteria b